MRGRRSAKFPCEPAPAESSTGRFANIRRTYRKNAEQLRGMYDQSVATGREVRGYSREQLLAKVAEFEALSQMSDWDLERHFERAGTLAAARLAELRGGRS